MKPSTRPARPSDFTRIKEIFLEHYADKFNLPSHRMLVDECVTTDGNAYGMVRLFAEAFMLLDHNVSQRKKIELITLLLEKAYEVCKRSNMEEVVVFVDPNFADILEKHFGFERTEGVALTKKLEG